MPGLGPNGENWEGCCCMGRDSNCIVTNVSIVVSRTDENWRGKAEKDKRRDAEEGGLY